MHPDPSSIGSAHSYARTARVASIAVALLLVGGVLSVVYLAGPRQLNWLYPAVVALFYLMRPRESLLCAMVAILALLPTLAPTHGPGELAILVITVLLTCALAYGLSVMIFRQHRCILDLATRDQLTGAGNRRGLAEKLDEVVHNFNRTYTPASIVLLDIDHFETINDAHGHAVGDQILRTITEIVNLRIRVTDSLYRIDGEKFVVLLDGADLHHAEHLARQLQTLVDANELARDPGVAISCGVAELRDNEASHEWLRRAEAALHRARETGPGAISLSA